MSTDSDRDRPAFRTITGLRSTVRYPICGDHQERNFTNATLQATVDPDASIEFSIAMFVDIDPSRLHSTVGSPAVDRVAYTLHTLFEWLGHQVSRADGPVDSVRFETEVGPCGTGDDYEEPPLKPTMYRTFVVSVPEDHLETAQLVERLELERPGTRVVERATTPGPRQRGQE